MRRGLAFVIGLDFLLEIKIFEKGFIMYVLLEGFPTGGGYITSLFAVRSRISTWGGRCQTPTQNPGVVELHYAFFFGEVINMCSVDVFFYTSASIFESLIPSEYINCPRNNLCRQEQQE